MPSAPYSCQAGLSATACSAVALYGGPSRSMVTRIGLFVADRAQKCSRTRSPWGTALGMPRVSWIP